MMVSVSWSSFFFAAASSLDYTLLYNSNTMKYIERMRVCMFEKLCNVVTIANIYIDFDTNCTVQLSTHATKWTVSIYGVHCGTWIWIRINRFDYQMHTDRGCILSNLGGFGNYIIDDGRIVQAVSVSIRCAYASIGNRIDRLTAQSIESLWESDSGRFTTTTSKLFNRESNTAQCLCVNSRNLFVNFSFYI